MSIWIRDEQQQADEVREIVLGERGRDIRGVVVLVGVLLAVGLLVFGISVSRSLDRLAAEQATQNRLRQLQVELAKEEGCRRALEVRYPNSRLRRLPRYGEGC